MIEANCFYAKLSGRLIVQFTRSTHAPTILCASCITAVFGWWRSVAVTRCVRSTKLLYARAG